MHKIQEKIELNGTEHKIKFVHLRATDDNDNILMKGGVTHAFIGEKLECAVHQASAECSMRDNFNRKLGRKISSGRLVKALEASKKAAKDLKKAATDAKKIVELAA